MPFGEVAVYSHKAKTKEVNSPRKQSKINLKQPCRPILYSVNSPENRCSQNESQQDTKALAGHLVRASNMHTVHYGTVLSTWFPTDLHLIKMCLSAWMDRQKSQKDSKRRSFWQCCYASTKKSDELLTQTGVAARIWHLRRGTHWDSILSRWAVQFAKEPAHWHFGYDALMRWKTTVISSLAEGGLIYHEQSMNQTRSPAAMLYHTWSNKKKGWTANARRLLPWHPRLSWEALPSSSHLWNNCEEDGAKIVTHLWNLEYTNSHSLHVKPCLTLADVLHQVLPCKIHPLIFLLHFFTVKGPRIHQRRHSASLLRHGCRPTQGVQPHHDGR